MIIKYEINRVELQANGYYVSYGRLIIPDSPTYHIFHVISGKYGRGSIPIGIYNLEEPVKLTDTTDYEAYKKEAIPWIAKLTPLGKCSDDQGERFGLAIHPDGNIEGTLGCIGIKRHDMKCFNVLWGAWKKNKKVTVMVC